MRVLFTVTGAWGTGSFQVANGVANQLRKHGHKTCLFFPDTPGEADQHSYYYQHPELYHIWRFPITNGQVKLKSYPLMLPDPNPRSPFGKTFKHLTPQESHLYFDTLTKQLSHVLTKFKPDIIECQHIWAMDQVIGKLGYPYIVVAHNSDQLALQYDADMLEAAMLSANNAQCIFAVSEGVKAQVEKIYRVSPDKVVAMPCGYDPHIFKLLSLDKEKTLRQFNLDIPLDAKIVCFSGKISHTKGIDVLLQANALLSAELNIHILLLGSGDVKTELSEREMALSSFDRVHFLGHRSHKEVAILNNIAHVNVVPSRTEGFCISALEAVACGTPVIMTETAGMGNYQIAKVIQSEDPQALADALSEIFMLPEKKYQQLSQDALDSAQNFTWDKVIAKRLKYYKKFLIRK